jgi:hypothetical protein
MWALVIVTPEVSKTIVFNKGIPRGEKHSIPTGGHTPPIKGEGAKLEWKNAQKNETKNIISETINKIKPSRKPFWTASVWKPASASLKTFLAQENKPKRTPKTPSENTQLNPKLWKLDILPNAMKKTDQAVQKGKILVGSIWNGCAFLTCDVEKLCLKTRVLPNFSGNNELLLTSKLIFYINRAS